MPKEVVGRVDVYRILQPDGTWDGNRREHVPDPLERPLERIGIGLWGHEAARLMNVKIADAYAILAKSPLVVTQGYVAVRQDTPVNEEFVRHARKSSGHPGTPEEANGRGGGRDRILT